jgi:hypothetical protein
MICIENLFLHCISHICGACWASAPCSAPIFVSAVLRFISTQAHPLFLVWGPTGLCTNLFFSGGRTNRTLHQPIFSIVCHHHHYLLHLSTSLLRSQLLAALSFVISSQHPFFVSANEPSLFLTVHIWRNIKL